MTTRPRQARQRLFREYHVDATAFLHEIVRKRRRPSTAIRRSISARAGGCRAIERCGGAPTFSHLGRSLGISRQAAREQAVKAARAGVVELLMTPDDRRALQVALTPIGRRELERQRMPQFSWVFTLLNGLDEDVMRETHHVLEVIRRRLERHASELRQGVRTARAAPRAG